MSAQELEQMVEKIVLRVMQRIQSDDSLAPLVKSETKSEKNQWVRTCSTYRDQQSVDVPQPRTELGENNSQVSNKKLYTESDIIDLAKSGQTSLRVTKKTIITPAAQDAAKTRYLNQPWKMHHIDRQFWNHNSLSPGDVDKDGLDDYLVIHEGADKVTILFYPGSGRQL